MIKIHQSDNRLEVFEKAQQLLQQHNIDIANMDENRPWGGFFVVDEACTSAFIQVFFPELDELDPSLQGKLSPKILLVEPQKRLSWQYHHRRSEIWKLIGGTAYIALSTTDEETIPMPLVKNIPVRIRLQERHRLIGGNKWGVIAEIWQHAEPDNPSNEDDIIRVQDDFGRPKQG